MGEDTLFVVFLPAEGRWVAPAGRLVDGPARAKLFTVRAWAEALARRLVTGEAKVKKRGREEDGSLAAWTELVRYGGTVEVQQLDTSFALVHADRSEEAAWPGT